MAKIYTRTGDQGETALLRGGRVPKDSLQVDCYGNVDEANSALGLARGMVSCLRLGEILLEIQQRLFTLGAELASPPQELGKLADRIDDKDIERLEAWIDELIAAYPLDKGFVLPGGTPGAGSLDLARTVVRRAERLTTRLTREQGDRQAVLQYLNRLSDLLYVMARAEARSVLKETVRQVVARLTVGPEVVPKNAIMNLDSARDMLAGARDCAKRIGVPMVVAVCDGGGNLIALERQDGALLASIDIARKKAYTAVALQMATSRLAEMVQPGQSLFGLESSTEQGLVVFGGGMPLWEGDNLLGAIGVSGGSVEQDEEVAWAGVAALGGRESG